MQGGRHWRTDVGWLLLAMLLVWGWTYGLCSLEGVDECRYVRVGEELLGRTNWLLLTLNGKPYDQKPPLPFWMIAGMIKLDQGVISGWAVRLPSVLFSVMTVLLTYALGRRRFGREVGWWSAWLLLTAPLLLKEAATARLDMLVTGAGMLAMFAWLGQRPGQTPGWRRATLFWLGLVLSFFIKGPPMLLILLSALAVEMAATRSWRLLRELKFHIGLPVYLALAAGWLAALDLFVAEGFIANLIREQTVERVTSKQVHPGPFYYYLLELPFDGFVPGFFLAAGALAVLVMRRGQERDWPALRPVAAWFVVPLVWFSLAVGKREQYLLPLFPAIALLGGWLVARVIGTRRAPGWMKMIWGLLTSAAGCAGLAVAAIFIVRPDVFLNIELEPTPVRAALMAVFSLGLLTAAVAFFSRRVRTWSHLAALAIASLLLVNVASMGVISPAINVFRDTTRFSLIIDCLLMGHPDKKAGAMGHGRDEDFLAHGNYDIDRLKSEPERLRPELPTLPPVLLADPESWQEAAPTLAGLGYLPICKTSKRLEEVTLYYRVGFDTLESLRAQDHLPRPPSL